MRCVSIIFPPSHKNINPPLVSSLTEIYTHLLQSFLTFSLTAKVHNICISSLRFHEQVSVTTSSQAHNAILATQFPNQEILSSPQLLKLWCNLNIPFAWVFILFCSLALLRLLYNPTDVGVPQGSDKHLQWRLSSHTHSLG